MDRHILVFLSLLMTGACTADLRIFEQGIEKEIDGVPFRGNEVWVAEGMYTRHTKLGKNCTPTVFQENQIITTGTLYYAKPDPGWFADSEFSITFNDNGSVKQIQLNSESNLAENITAVSGLAGTILPYLATPRVSAEILAIEQADACNTGKNILSLVRLDKWTPDTWRP